jgi:hypothetical protein
MQERRMKRGHGLLFRLYVSQPAPRRPASGNDGMGFTLFSPLVQDPFKTGEIPVIFHAFPGDSV